jgi:hypothetical protein
MRKFARDVAAAIVAALILDAISQPAKLAAIAAVLVIAVVAAAFVIGSLAAIVLI